MLIYRCSEKYQKNNKNSIKKLIGTARKLTISNNINLIKC